MADTVTTPVIKIGGVEITSVQAKPQRISMLLWGPSGCGKTTLACTAPGRKLLILFDPDGDASVTGRDDVDVADLTKGGNNVVEQFKSDTNPLGIAKVMSQYDTFIFDSLTNAQHMSVMNGVSKLKGATVEKPSMETYQYRNAMITQLVKNVLMLTAKHGKHVIFVAHEAQPEKNDQGIVLAITVALGGQLQTSAPVDFSEVWNMQDTGKTRRIAIRPSRMRAPCKTRMFKTDGAAEFDWNYTGTDIADWFAAWQAGNYIKLSLPK
jgi:hypothetical protein